MVFHEIDSITDVNSGYRFIIYYVESRSEVNNGTNMSSKLQRFVEAVMELLEKKNDDLIIFKILEKSPQFAQLQELYKPEVKGAVTLLAVNQKGIPVTCQYVENEHNIQNVVDSLCMFCNLNHISVTEISTKLNKVVCDDQRVMSDSNWPTGNLNCSIPVNDSVQSTGSADIQNKSTSKDAGVRNSDETVESPPDLTRARPHLISRLQIRLPDGNRDTQKFNQDATLNEVRVFISDKHNLKDFDLKTYNHENFTPHDYEKSLQDLELVPNGVIMVVVKNTVSMKYSWVGTVIQHGFQQLKSKAVFTFRYLQGTMFMIWNSLFSTNNRPTNNQSRSINSGQTSEGRSNKVSNRKTTIKNSTSRAFGNIHTLGRNEDSDDENNRYNGNSTQQK